jgi:hypothetical protein
MSIGDPYKLRVGAGGLVLVVGITLLRFCGSLSLPRRGQPAPPPVETATSKMSKSAANPTVYRTFLEHDAINAGVRTPTIEEMSRKLTYRTDEARHVLEVGRPAIEIAGLRLRIEHASDSLVLEIENRTGSDVAYEVTTQTAPKVRDCNTARALPFDALVLGKDATETRAECVWHDNLALVVTKVETLELSPLGAFYIHQLPTSLLNLEPRIARGHHQTGEICPAMVAQSVRAGVANGEIGWRDLIDFYARHRCQTYQFPSEYRAFKSDSEHSIPYVDTGN